MDSMTVTARSARLPRRIVAWSVAAALALLTVLIILIAGPFVAVAVTGAAVMLLVLLRFPWIGIALLVASVPAQEFGAVQSLTVTRVTFPVAVAGLLIGLLVRREPVRWTRLSVPYMLLVGMFAVSIVWAASTSAALAEVGRWAIALVSFLIAVQFLVDASRARIMAFIGVLALGGVFEATFGVTQSLLALGPASFQFGAGSRAFGTFGQPNSYAGYLEMVFFPVFWVGVYVASTLPSLLAGYRRQRLSGRDASSRQRYRLLLNALLAAALLGASAIILSGIVASYSRGAWLGVAAGGVVSALFFHRWVRRAAPLMIPVGILLFAGGLASIAPASVNERISTGFEDIRPFDAASITITHQNFAAAERMAHWQAGWQMFDDQPFRGVGAGNFNERYEDYFVRQEFRFTRGHAHNFYIHMLAEVGLVGLMLYLSLIASFVALALIVLVRAPAGFERMLALGAFGTIVSVGVHNVFENLHVLNLSIQLGLVWALVVVAHRRWKHSTSNPPLEMRS